MSDTATTLAMESTALAAGVLYLLRQAHAARQAVRLHTWNKRPSLAIVHPGAHGLMCATGLGGEESGVGVRKHCQATGGAARANALAPTKL